MCCVLFKVRKNDGLFSRFFLHNNMVRHQIQIHMTLNIMVNGKCLLMVQGIVQANKLETAAPIFGTKIIILLHNLKQLFHLCAQNHASPFAIYGVIGTLIA